MHGKPVHVTNSLLTKLQMYNVTRKADLHILSVELEVKNATQEDLQLPKGISFQAFLHHAWPSIRVSCSIFISPSRSVHYELSVSVNTSLSIFHPHSLSSRAVNSHGHAASNRRPCLRVIEAGVGEVESKTGNRYSSQLWIAKLTVCAHRRESCCVVHAGITWRVDASELRSNCAPHPRPRIDSTSSVNRSLLL